MPLSAEDIQAIFKNLSSPDTASKFWDHVADDVHWTIIGSTQMSGVVSVSLSSHHSRHQNEGH